MSLNGLMIDEIFNESADKDNFELPTSEEEVK